MRPHLPWLIPGGLAFAGLLLLVPDAAATLVLSGIPAGLVLAAGAGFGSLALRWLPLDDPWQRGLIATALGVGVLGHLTLGLALAGLLGQATAAGLIVVGLVAGWATLRRSPTEPPPLPESRLAASGLFAAAILAVPLGMLLLAATLPPGALWEGEARGYDVLEYHLQGPREWFAAGRMQFLPHNVYTTFPQQVEVLYLLLMHLVGDHLSAAVPSQLLHAFLTIAAIATLGAFTPAGWPRIVVLLAAGSVPWLLIVGSLAYVEGGLLLFAAAAGALLLAARRGEMSLLVAAGVCAGFAGGCKYTALALVAAALPAAWLLFGGGVLTARLRGAALIAVAAGVVFAPWAIRNAAWTGNPVYPFAYEVFGGAAWSPDQAARWDRGHHVSLTLAERMGVLCRELGARRTGAGIAFSYFGAVFPLAVLAGLVTRTRRGWLMLVWLGAIVLVWALATHMPGRFAIVALAPIGLLLGEALTEARARTGLLRTIGHGVAAAGVVVAFVGLWTGQAALDRNVSFWREREIAVGDLAGNPGAFAASHALNELPAESRVWLIGDAAVFYIDRPVHYTVVFSRDPWLERGEAGATPEELVAWLRAGGWTHVAVHGSEVRRLRATYGFSEVVTEAWLRDLVERGGLVPVLPEASTAGYVVLAIPS